MCARSHCSKSAGLPGAAGLPNLRTKSAVRRSGPPEGCLRNPHGCSSGFRLWGDTSNTHNPPVGIAEEVSPSVHPSVRSIPDLSLDHFPPVRDTAGKGRFCTRLRLGTGRLLPPRLGRGDWLLSMHSLVACPQLIDRAIDVFRGDTSRSSLTASPPFQFRSRFSTKVSDAHVIVSPITLVGPAEAATAIPTPS